jgi:hypothetical protein
MQYPSRPSRLRQLAYQSNIDVPGPYSDLDGWLALDPVQIQGKIFGERTVNAKCTVRWTLGLAAVRYFYLFYVRFSLRNRLVVLTRRPSSVLTIELFI